MCAHVCVVHAHTDELIEGMIKEWVVWGVRHFRKHQPVSLLVRHVRIFYCFLGLIASLSQ